MQENVRDQVLAWRSQLRKGTLELAVLQLLRKERRYGLELVDVLNAHGFGVSEGSIYPLLSRLRTEEKVETEWVDDGVGHAHKYYRLTAHGQATCHAMQKAWREFNRAFDRVTGDES